MTVEDTLFDPPPREPRPEVHIWPTAKELSKDYRRCDPDVIDRLNAADEDER